MRNERDTLVANQHNLAIEKGIAIAHQALAFSIDHATYFRDLGIHDDIQLILLELERLQEDLLKRGRRRPTLLTRPAYLSSSPRDDSRSAS